MTQQSVAIIGSGMAGLAAAHFFKEAGHQVTVFESLPAQGMDSHTAFLHGGIVDVPLRVMSPSIWKNTLALAKHVGVQTFDVHTFLSCSWTNGKTWFRTARHDRTQLPMLGSWRYLNFKTALIAKNFIQLSWALHRLKKNPQQITLADFLEQHQFNPLFWRGIILPVLMTICTCEESSLMAWPALKLLDIMQNIIHGETLVRLKDGTPALVKALSRDIQFISGSAVTKVVSSERHISVRNARGDHLDVDRVVIATPTHAINFLDQTEFNTELNLLKQFSFDSGELWVHTDPKFMPNNKVDWTAINYQSTTDLSKQMFSVWVNAVEPSLQNKPDVFQTWNPLFEPDPRTVISRIPLVRAVVTQQSCAALQQLDQLQQQPNRRVFFCGSWASEGIPLLESAVQSALRVADYCDLKLSFNRPMID